MEKNLKIIFHSLRANILTKKGRFNIILSTIQYLIKIILIFSILNFALNRIGNFTLYSKKDLFLLFIFSTIIDSLNIIFSKSLNNVRRMLDNKSFDYFELKPYSSINKFLFNNLNIIDVVGVIFLTILLISYIIINYKLNPINVVTFIFLSLISIISLVSINLIEIVNSINNRNNPFQSINLIDGEMMMLGKFPITLYIQPFLFIFTFIIPVGVICYFPVSVFMKDFEIKYLFISVLYVTLLQIAQKYVKKNNYI